MPKTQATRSAARPETVKKKTVTHTKFNPKIEKRAYEIYMQRLSSGLAGDSKTDWLQAEREINSSRE